MGTVLVITSGKGGVGKTTSTAALGAALAQGGQNVVVVDFDVGLRNLDLVMGAERRVVFDLINVVHGDAKLSQALIRDKRLDTLSILPASQTRDKDALTDEGVARVIGELREKFDWVICDSPAGIERGATLAMRHADIAIVLSFFHRPRSAPVARERLQLLLAHERSASDGRSDLLEVLRDEILQVISKHAAVDRKKLKISLDRQEGLSTLEVEIEIRTPSSVLLEDGGRKVA